MMPSANQCGCKTTKFPTTGKAIKEIFQYSPCSLRVRQIALAVLHSIHESGAIHRKIHGNRTNNVVDISDGNEASRRHYRYERAPLRSTRHKMHVAKIGTIAQVSSRNFRSNADGVVHTI